jgi:ABC-2 type transport system permease protein
MSLTGWPFLALLVLFSGSLSIEMWQHFRTGEYGTALMPTTSLVLDRLQDTLLPFGILLIVYWSAELVWRDRAVFIHEIVDSTPSPNGLLLASALLTLAALVVALTVAGALTGIAFQIGLGPVPVEATLYLSLLVFTGIPLVLLGALAVFLQALAPNRYVGMLAMVLATVFWHRGGLGGFQHPLLRYASAPTVGHSDLSGFSPLAGTFFWLMGYGGAVACLLTIVAAALWRRGTEERLSARIRAFPRSFRPALGGSALVLATLAGYVYQQSSVVNAFETREQVLAWRASYERAYRALDSEPQPTVAGQSVTVDLYPERGRARARGRLTLENRGPVGIDSIWISTPRGLRSVTLTLEGRAPDRIDARHSMRHFALSQPLAPDASIDLAFDVLLERRGVAADGDALEEIVPNGSFLLGSQFLPTVGFRFTTMIRDARERVLQGLPELTDPARPDDDELVHDVAPKIPIETVVSTSPGETAVAPGALSASWVENGRPHFRYKAMHPVSPDLGIASARWAVAKRVVRGVEVSVWYHPAHAMNVDAILSAAGRTVEYGIRNFGPYPLPELRIVEIPSTWRQFGGLAMPGLIFLVESRAFVTDRRDPGRVDIVSKRVAHEVAHQWWGREVAPAHGPGAAVIVESLARYTELMILKEMYGREAVEAPLSSELRRYLRGRAGDLEVPLAQATNQSYLYYAKGALVFTALEDLVGEQALNRGLGTFAAEASSLGAAPRIADLVAVLRGVTSPENHPLLDEWFHQMVLYDLRVTAASATPLRDGRFQVTATLCSDRVSVDAAGKETPSIPKDPVEIEILGEGRVLHSEKRLIAGASEISVIVTGRPTEVVVDPHLRRIDRNRFDNRRKVEAKRR